MFRPSRIIIFLLTFLVPFLTVTVYMLRFATDRFDSESAIIITEESGAAATIDLSAIGLPAPPSQRDPLVLAEFIQSADMLRHLEAKLSLRAHYSAPDIDWWHRLPAGYSLEDFHDYMAHFLVVEFDTDSQIIKLHVESFNREFSQQVLNAVLARSQQFIDQLNDKVTAGQTQFLEAKLVETEGRLRAARNELVTFQTQNRLMSTEQEALMVSTNIGELEKQLLAKSGELETRLQVLSNTSPVIQLLQQEIETLKDQLDQEKDRLSGGSSLAVNELDAKFREIQFNVEFMTNLYKSNLAQLEQARVTAAQRLKYLVVVTQPSVADASLYPNRGFIIGTAAMVLFMIFFVISLIVAIIREHA
jgi:capsular polysaccharide transport system permease protein